MRKSALRFLIITGLLKLALFTHVYVHTEMTWSRARNFCKDYYTDMSSVFSSSENDALLSVRGDDDQRRRHVWLGLHKDENDTWMWSDGRPASFFKWGQQIAPAESGRCVVLTQSNVWLKKSCTEEYATYCSIKEAVLVKENKTWEEALEYCRDRQSDLVSLTSEFTQNDVLERSQDAQTARVWTGLRYLADSWLWVNGEKMMFQAWRGDEMPRCPAPTHRCGTLVLKEEHWESWDCTDKLNFVCY